MPTANRRHFVPRAIRYFLAQDYADKELLILDDGEDSAEDLVPQHPQIRYLRPQRRRPIGTKRNMACEQARGEIIVHWDDDDWSAPWRLGYQVGELARTGAEVCGLDRVLFVDPRAGGAWEYVYPRGSQPWVYGATLCYRKSFWRGNPFPDINVGEDSRFVWNARGARVVALARNDFYVGLVHRANTSPKQVRDPRWQAKTIEEVEALIGPDWPAYAGGAPGPAAAAEPDRPAALVAAALGIGDILRITPLIRVLHRLGYQVDVLAAPDYAQTIELLRGAPEIRRLFHYATLRADRGSRPLPEVVQSRYELAAFTHWAAPMARWVKARAQHHFEYGHWLVDGDSAGVERIARAVGWQGPLPAPFAIASDRRFDLPAGTIALHPGCKPDWPWKKWHGFDQLARLLPAVAIVGAPADLDNGGTYFRRAFDWPAHAHDFVGRLDLRDTAALLGQCTALVANDSGLMHLAAVLGVPTFGIFGITSPQREAMPLPNMIPVTKALPCEAACRRQAWGRRDCERHLECLKALTAAEVADRVRAGLARKAPVDAGRRGEEEPMERISLNYYGYVFDASGYGQAARAYIHALIAAGIKVSVVDIGARPRQVDDDLVAASLGCDPLADFNLFHGIPPQWAHLAYPLRNVIAMTVWETDTMPARWRNPLSHALDVWLPCAFNVDVFGSALGRAPFRLPHCVPAAGLNGARYEPQELRRLEIGADDYVFYSIFEWQERKNPVGLLQAFLHAFPQENDALLFIKSNPGALDAAARTLHEAREATGSRGRIRLCCEAWSDAQLQALHDRGDCYVSLHKGEGWGYPLFEAACRGKPTVATGYSGPADYLDPAHHWLVRHQSAAVRQHYAYYHPSMKWAEPDLAHACAGMRRAYEQRDAVRALAAEAAGGLRRTYAPQAIGASARTRLLSLLRTTNPRKWSVLERAERAARLRPALPIPGAWYDADYFEHGLKSNWSQGYTWELFRGLFEETADYLLEMFPEAESFLDIGCGKGFLVATLRARGRDAFGFDHSAWAIDRAAAAAGPYLRLAGVEEAQYDRQFDVVTAFSVLESLTEAQIDRAIDRARGWVRQAFLAFIPTVPDGAPVHRAAEDCDLSHVTLRGRAWWHDRFLAAGWRQDALHRIVERRCRTHPLVQRMGWEIYVYAP